MELHFSRTFECNVRRWLWNHGFTSFIHKQCLKPLIDRSFVFFNYQHFYIWLSWLPETTSAWYFKDLFKRNTQTSLFSIPRFVYKTFFCRHTHFHSITSFKRITAEYTRQIPPKRGWMACVRIYSVICQSHSSEISSSSHNFPLPERCSKIFPRSLFERTPTFFSWAVVGAV